MNQSGIDHPLRVVAYTDSEGIGGAEISLSHLVASVSRGIDVTVLGTSQPVVDAIAARRPQALRQVITAKNSLFAHRVILHRLRPNVVHINLCTPWAGATGLLAALSLPYARVVRVDQLPLRTTDAIALWRTRALSLRVDAHIAVGEASARKMEDFYALGRNTVISVPNCVPDVTTPPTPTIVRPDRKLVIGSVGRLDRMKGHDILIQALAQVEQVQAIILGEGAERTALEHLAAELGVSDRLELHGWINDPRAHLPKFDVVVMPSRSEGFPLAIIEAMLAARPVIATRVGSVAEAVIDGETGLLIDKDDVDGLAIALRRLQDDPELCQHLGQRGREVAVARFTVEHMAASYEHIWHQIVAAPQVPRLYVPRPRD